MKTIKLLLAEDQTILRQGLIDILDKYDDICIVAEAENGHAMISKYFDHKPHVVLSDIEMPSKDGFSAADEILKRDRSAKIIFLTMYNSDDYMYHAFKMGAAGMISKSVLKSELIKAIRLVADGQKYFMNKTEKELSEMASRIKKEASSIPADDLLSPRQKSILEYIAAGLKSEEIAANLNLSKRTVDVERSKIMSILNLEESHHLVLYAIKQNLKKNAFKMP